MQREILFRGKRVDNGEWVEGNYIEKIKPTEVNPVFWCCFIQDKAISMYEVIPESIGQFTGLTDKNGKKIFEGDILKYEDFIFIVGFTQAKFKALLKDAKDTSQILGVLLWCESDIIGNVTENPELLNQ